MTIFVKEELDIVNRNIENAKDYLRKINYFNNNDNIEAFELYKNRTKKHIELTIENAKRIQSVISFTPNLIDISKVHDANKFYEPELIPYISLTLEKLGVTDKDEYTKKYNKGLSNKATLHHIIFNAHHPEFYHPTKLEMTDTGFDRKDGSKQQVIAYTMPFIYIAEMICDWKAMSQELGTNINEWKENNVNKRWLFTEQQVEYMEKFIDILK
jgi:hypothetical protein